jgi:hypothetical protein
MFQVHVGDNAYQDEKKKKQKRDNQPAHQDKDGAVEQQKAGGASGLKGSGREELVHHGLGVNSTNKLRKEYKKK